MRLRGDPPDRPSPPGIVEPHLTNQPESAEQPMYQGPSRQTRRFGKPIALPTPSRLRRIVRRTASRHSQSAPLAPGRQGTAVSEVPHVPCVSHLSSHAGRFPRPDPNHRHRGHALMPGPRPRRAHAPKTPRRGPRRSARPVRSRRPRRPAPHRHPRRATCFSYFPRDVKPALPSPAYHWGRPVLGRGSSATVLGLGGARWPEAFLSGKDGVGIRITRGADARFSENVEGFSTAC